MPDDPTVCEHCWNPPPCLCAALEWTPGPRGGPGDFKEVISPGVRAIISKPLVYGAHPKTWNTGKDSWIHGSKMPGVRHCFLGPCPACGSRCFDYGGGWRCIAVHCCNSADAMYPSLGEAPWWWATDIQVVHRGMNDWVASAAVGNVHGGTPGQAASLLREQNQHLSSVEAELRTEQQEHAHDDRRYKETIAALRAERAHADEAVAILRAIVAATGDIIGEGVAEGDQWAIRQRNWAQVDAVDDERKAWEAARIGWCASCSASRYGEPGNRCAVCGTALAPREARSGH